MTLPTGGFEGITTRTDTGATVAKMSPSTGFVGEGTSSPFLISLFCDPGKR
jgi:hypothetical protein